MGHGLMKHRVSAKLHRRPRQDTIALGKAEGVEVGRRLHFHIRNAVSHLRRVGTELEDAKGRLLGEKSGVADEVDPIITREGARIGQGVCRARVANCLLQIVLPNIVPYRSKRLRIYDEHVVAVGQCQHPVADANCIHVGVVVWRERRHVGHGVVPRWLPWRLCLEEQQSWADRVRLLRLVVEACGQESVRRADLVTIDLELLQLAEAVQKTDKVAIAHLELSQTRNDEAALHVWWEGVRCRQTPVAELLVRGFEEQIVTDILLPKDLLAADCGRACSGSSLLHGSGGHTDIKLLVGTLGEQVVTDVPLAAD
mmetsp:Transcript_80121/g.258976  ORF Transcript_80121/g.258976 Transcript_80121/m.258976 type:complete len:312 (+) Transcript_80121:801-1736(+)